MGQAEHRWHNASIYYYDNEKDRLLLDCVLSARRFVHCDSLAGIGAMPDLAADAASMLAMLVYAASSSTTCAA